MLVGYARVSTVGQSLEVQEEQLTAAGCERVFAEKRSGKSMEEREQLAQALAFVREGDTLVVTRLDRCGWLGGQGCDLSLLAAGCNRHDPI
jgi:DNA invertase Pin-like site-specific DNA recombinase